MTLELIFDSLSRLIKPICLFDAYLTARIDKFLIYYLTVPQLPFLAYYLPAYFKIAFYGVFLFILSGLLKITHSESEAYSLLFYVLFFVLFFSIVLIFFGFFVLLFT
ncbi:hypothetical protein IPM62_05855 [Candidatus Woesebacteria bacterium]|nr:MAG: hypothetical protein IPM62_05855 [Candidatus Woesebacteria bacterium]